MKNTNKERIEDLLMQMLHKAKESKHGLDNLIRISISFKQYELAREIRELKIKLFPETEIDKERNEKIQVIQTLFKMCDMDVPEKAAFIAYELVSLYNKKEGNTDMDSVSEIQANADKFYGK